jgi:magnesium transporter
MNVPLPLEKEKYAIYVIVSISIVVSLLVTWYFQRKRLF